MSINVVVPVPLSIVCAIKDGISAEKDEEAYYDLVWTAGVSLIEAVRALRFDIRPSVEPEMEETTKISSGMKPERKVPNKAPAQESKESLRHQESRESKPKSILGRWSVLSRKHPVKSTQALESTPAATPIQTATPVQTPTPMRSAAQSQSPRPIQRQRPIDFSRPLQTQRPVQLTQPFQRCNGMQVFVKTLTGKTRTFEMTRTSTTVDLARAVEAQEGIPVEDQRLIFAGKQLPLLDDGDRRNVTLASLGIHSESTLHLVLRLKGS